MLFLVCIPILFAVANLSSAITRGKEYNARIVRDIYEYNHPPNVISVPVAIVYDEENRQEKSVDPVSIPNPDDQNTISDLTTTEETPTPTEIPTKKVLKAHFSVSDEQYTETRSEDQLIIPVAVIYDDESNIPSSPKVLTKSKSTNRQQRNRKVVKNVEENKELTSQENEASTQFPKRTQDRDAIVPILQSENYVFSDAGNFHYRYIFE